VLQVGTLMLLRDDRQVALLLHAHDRFVQALLEGGELQAEVLDPLAGELVGLGHGLAAVVLAPGGDGVLREELLEQAEELRAVEHGADAEVPAARGGALVDQDVRARDVAHVDVGGDGVGVGPPGSREVARDVAAAEVERALQHGPHGHAGDDDGERQAAARALLRRRGLRRHLGAAVEVARALAEGVVAPARLVQHRVRAAVGVHVHRAVGRGEHHPARALVRRRVHHVAGALHGNRHQLLRKLAS
jgi:hypothetical protein